MKRALGIALAIHLCLLLVAGYIYVLPPGKREALFRAVLRAEKIMPKKEVRTAPKKKLKKAPTIRPLKRKRAIELIGVKRAITSEFTVKLPEISAVYSPQLALISIPEPTVSERLPSFWERQIQLKGRQIELESFGVTSLKPLGSAENPVTRLIFQITGPLSCGCCHWDVGISYPEQRLIARDVTEGRDMSPQIQLGPYAVPPEGFIFYADASKSSCEHGVGFYFSTDTAQCHQKRIGANTIQYEWEVDREPYDLDYNDLFFVVTFIGAGSGM